MRTAFLENATAGSWNADHCHTCAIPADLRAKECAAARTIQAALRQYGMKQNLSLLVIQHAAARCIQGAWR